MAPTRNAPRSSCGTPRIVSGLQLIKLNKEVMQVAKAVLKHVLWRFEDEWTFPNAASEKLKTFSWKRDLGRILEDQVGNGANQKIESIKDAERAADDRCA